MYHFYYPAALLMASYIFSHARCSVFKYYDGKHSFKPRIPKSDVCMKPKCVIAASGVLTSIDETVDPCDDFQRFACGGWIKRHEEQPETNFIVERENNLIRQLRDLLESPYNSSDQPFVKLLKDYYNTCMDVDSIEKAGSEPLKKMLNRLGKWPLIEGSDWDESRFDWVDTLIALRELGFDHNILMYLDVTPKSSNDTVHIMLLGAPFDILPDSSNLTLGLSDSKITTYYKKALNTANLLGINETTAERELLEIVNFAIALKKSALVQEEESVEITFLDEPIKYHTVKDLQKEVPKIPWLKYFNGLFNIEVYENDTVYVRNMDFIRRLADLTTSTEKRVIANYIMMKVVFESSMHLSKEWKNIDEELTEFETCKERKMARWKKCMAQVKEGMEIALSAYYVRQYFPDKNKDGAINILRYIRTAILEIMDENDWSDERKEMEEAKATQLQYYIFYPWDFLNDTYMMITYENLTIATDSHFENVLKLKKMLVDRALSLLRIEMDYKFHSKFEYVVQANAFYNPYVNSIGIPDSLLHYAFYESDRPNYLNFGAIGVIMDYEITHGFDNIGVYFDKENEVNWWDKQSDEHFRKKVACIKYQHDNYTTDNGKKDMNILRYIRTSILEAMERNDRTDDKKEKAEKKANRDSSQNDNGGLKEAYWAYQSWIADNGIEPTLPGLKYSQNQLFWLNAAQVWCSKYLPEQLRIKLSDPHNPDQYRIIGPMSNLKEFSKDFKCSADSPMNRKYDCNE